MRSSVTLLVLAHLGITACGKDDKPVDPAPAKVCHADGDCGDTSKRCVNPDGGATGICVPKPTRGRPLVVDGIAHVASYASETATTVTDDEVLALLEAAREEHASIAAFARTIAELLALGAPLSLLHETQIALGDEIRHTEMTLTLLERLTGSARQIAPLEAATLPLRRSVADFFRDVLHGGAMGETLAAADAAARREQATAPELRGYYDAIMNDEARHAALAFKTLRWLRDAHPELTAVLDEELPRISPAARALTAPLFAAIAS